MSRQVNPSRAALEKIGPICFARFELTELGRAALARSTHRPTTSRPATADERAGMDWWNGLSEPARGAWLGRCESIAEAWAWHKAACEFAGAKPRARALRSNGPLFDAPLRSQRPRVQYRYDVANGGGFMLVDRGRVGDPATLPDVGNRRWLVAHCTSTSTLMLGCLSCRQPLATLQQLLYHLETAPGQTHVLARQCGEHGWEALEESGAGHPE